MIMVDEIFHKKRSINTGIFLKQNKRNSIKLRNKLPMNTFTMLGRLFKSDEDKKKKLIREF